MAFTKEELKGSSKNDLIRIILLQQTQFEEQRRMIEAQRDIIEKQAFTIVALEERIARLEKNSGNSSKPPSTDQNGPPRNQSLREKTNRKPGGQKGHLGYTRKQVETPDEVSLCLPAEACENCGSSLNPNNAKIIEKRQEVEIPEIKPKVTEYQKMAITCPCGHCNKGNFPEHVTSSVQMGQTMKFFLIYLNVVHLIPYHRLTTVMKDLFQVQICKRSIENALEEATQKGQSLYQDIMRIVKNGTWVGSDETGKRVEGKRWWEWVWQHEKASYYAIEKGRGYAVVKKHFGEDYGGVLIHDCWSAHNNTVAKAGHQQCLAHIQRDLTFLVEAHKSRWAYDLSHFLRSAQKARTHIWSEGFDYEIRQKIIQDYQEKFLLFLVKTTRQKDVLRLQKRVIKHQSAILHFMTSPTIPFHNNGSERAIRMSKVKQKISGGFRSQRGAERQAILLSIIETAKKQGFDLLFAIRNTLRGSLLFQGG